MKGLMNTAFERTMATLRRDGRLLWPVALMFLVIPGVLGDLALPRTADQQAGALPLVIMAALLVISLIGQLAIIRLALGAGNDVRESIGEGVRRFPRLLGAILLLVIPIAILLSPLILRIAAAPQGQVPPGDAFILLAALMLLIALSVRFALSGSIAAMEPAGPIALLKRSWILTSGIGLRLFGLLLLFLIVALVLMVAVQSVVGAAVTLALGPTEPWTVSTLLVSLAVQLVQAVLSVPLVVFLANLYRLRAEREAA